MERSERSNVRPVPIEEAIVYMLKSVFDPEIPVNIYDLGLVYDVDIDEYDDVTIQMTLTSPTCPAAEFIVEDVKEKVGSLAGIRSVNVRLVFDPAWSKEMMTKEARLELGLL